MFKWGKKLFQQGKKLFQQGKKIVYGSVIIDIGSWDMNNLLEHITELQNFKHKEILRVGAVIKLDPPLQKRIAYREGGGFIRIENNNIIVLHHAFDSYYGLSKFTKETCLSRGKIQIEYREKLC